MGVALCFERLDEGLCGGLGPAATTALKEWASQNDVTFQLGHWLTNADSVTKVGLVREHGDEGTRNIIVKHGSVYGGFPRDVGSAELGEFARQRRATRDEPRFAARHLVQPVHLPLRVGDGTWLTFHEVPGGSVQDFTTLGTVLDALLHPPPRSAGRSEYRTVSCDGDGFAQICGGLVRSMLAEWARQPRVVAATVPEFIEWQRRGGGVADTTAHATGSFARGEPDAPASLTDPTRTHGVVVPALVGKAHGNLQLDNVLVPVRPGTGATEFILVDLSGYADDAALIRDVVNLMLHAVARALPDLSPSQRDALIDLLVDRERVGPLIPGWLHAFVTRVETTAEEWARQFSLVDEWRDQMPLAVFACASSHVAGTRTRDEEREWFRRLAARSGAAFLARRGLAGPDPEAELSSARGRAEAGRATELSRAPTGSSPAPPGERSRAPDVELSPSERDLLVRALARAFPTDTTAHRILHNLGFPPERRRSTVDSTPLALWSATLFELDNGAVVDPYPRLLRAAVAEFPHNRTFRDLCARLGLSDDSVGG